MNVARPSLECYGVVELLLNVAGDNAWTLLTAKTIAGWTALHQSVLLGPIEMIKILLNAAGDEVENFMAMQTYKLKLTLYPGHTASEIASREEFREVMKLYQKPTCCVLF